ncbi:hypothetical protein CONLIGDRAFT_586395 [Coniochaeta ligniaria NRRL 30616]|uniref:Uncharacterized protein n=1 Tax=Coniochaeta ligniaria NRRL 30616 TaxID=1408157 RepID=A0A1J7I698_9PEZI|nr:hypothetical protein CONLIGDRAFT_586395 [Coniochaeta ligniaria NRRL 30616]
MSSAPSETSLSLADSQSGIVFSDPTEPFTVKPIIEDLLRTLYCIPGSIFLVEGIDYLSPIRRRYRAVRLLVSDGISCVQAVLKGEAHGLVDSGQIYAGCYVRVHGFELRFLDISDRENRPRKMVYLLLENPITIGWNTAYMKILDSQKQASPPDVAVLAEESERVAAGKTDKAPLPALQATTDRKTIAAHPSSEPLPWSTDDPTKPVKLTPLRLIPNLPYKQNWMVNVLAVVSSLSDVEPSHLPPYHQRTARLTDPSTSKQVLLTVFVDPDDFNPSVGSVVLILGVKNHRFDGGSLKKYASDRPKNGAQWWFEEPMELGWCDVAGLKAWWDSKHQKA